MASEDKTKKAEAGKKRREWTLDERKDLQDCLCRGMSITKAARILGRSRGTVSGEIKRNRCARADDMPIRPITKRNICARADRCMEKNLCEGKSCRVPNCGECREAICNEVCDKFTPVECDLLKEPPYVCNGCTQCMTGVGCKHPYLFYNAVAADRQARSLKKTSRAGIDLKDEELERLREIVLPALMLHQSPSYILASNPDLGISKSTLYRYINEGVLGRSLDLPEAVSRKPRKRAPKGAYPGGGVSEENLVGRTIADWNALSEAERNQTVEMDTVVGRQGKDSKCILTLYWPAWHFQIFILLPDHTSRSVVLGLDSICDIIGVDKFEEWFGVIKTDRGSEFADTSRIERTINGKKRCRVFYCDAFNSQQKGGCERNHRELRRLIPKGTTNFDALTREDMATLMSHVNSKLRPGTLPDGVAPIDLVLAAGLGDLLDALGVAKIPANEVSCSPMLLPHAIVQDKAPGKQAGTIEEARKLYVEGKAAGDQRCA